MLLPIPEETAEADLYSKYEWLVESEPLACRPPTPRTLSIDGSYFIPLGDCSSSGSSSSNSFASGIALESATA